MRPTTNSAGYSVLRTWCNRGDILCPCPNTPKPAQTELNRLWEELHYYNEGQLDELKELLTGISTVSSTKHAALEKLKFVIVKIFGSTPDDPKFIKRGRQRDNLKKERSALLDDEADINQSKKEYTMSTVKIKDVKSKKVAKGFPIVTKSPVVKKAASSKAIAKKPVAKKAGGIGEHIKECIKKKMEVEAVLASVKKKFPGSKTSKGCVYFYRSQLNEA